MGDPTCETGADLVIALPGGGIIVAEVDVEWPPSDMPGMETVGIAVAAAAICCALWLRLELGLL